jgi:hypothetical protein
VHHLAKYKDGTRVKNSKGAGKLEIKKGSLANTLGGAVFSITALSFGVAAVLVMLFLPETKGRELVS